MKIIHTCPFILGKDIDEYESVQKLQVDEKLKPKDCVPVFTSQCFDYSVAYNLIKALRKNYVLYIEGKEMLEILKQGLYYFS